MIGKRVLLGLLLATALAEYASTGPGASPKIREARTHQLVAA